MYEGALRKHKDPGQTQTDPDLKSTKYCTQIITILNLIQK